MKKIATLFSGGELVGIAARLAGLLHAWGIEIDPRIAEIATQNGFRTIIADVCQASFNELSRVHWLHASPPCTNASIANQKSGETALDYALAQAIIRAIKTLQPPMFSLENVANYKNFDSFSLILKELVSLGYKWDYRVLNSANYGDPQTRKRLILLAGRSHQRWPATTHFKAPTEQLSMWGKPWVGWFSAIEDLIPALPVSKRRKCPSCVQGICPGHFAPWQEKILVGQYRLLNSFLISGANRWGTQIQKSSPCPTITTSSGKQFRVFLMLGGNSSNKTNILLPRQPFATVTGAKAPHRLLMPCETNYRILRITPRCLARWQSMPDDYVLPESTELASRIIGNGVPVKMMTAIFRANI